MVDGELTLTLGSGRNLDRLSKCAGSPFATAVAAFSKGCAGDDFPSPARFRIRNI